MIIRNGIRSNLRSRGRTALFAGMILVLTLAMILALGVRLYSDAALARCDQLYRSIAMVEYMGAEYPDQDEADLSARAASDAIDDAAVLAMPGVSKWYRDCRGLGMIEGFRRFGNDMPFRDYAVLVVSHLSPMYEYAMTMDPDNPHAEPEPSTSGTGTLQYYTAIITRSLYSYEEKDRIFVSVLPDHMPEEVDYNASYVLHGSFVDGDSLGVSNGIRAFLVRSFPNTEEPPVVQLTPGEEPGSVFMQYAEHYRTINNYVQTVFCGDLNDLWEFHQGVIYLKEGRMPEAENECVISGDLADSMGISPGYSMDVTAFSSKENSRYDITLTDRRDTLTVVGVTNVNTDYTAYVWRQSEEPATTLFGYRIGVAQLENRRAVSAVTELEKLMPQNVRVTLLDQGYADAVEPFLSLQSTATNVLLLCAVGAFAVLVLFALLFVGRQSETVRILVSLGTPRRKIALWLLSGALVISGGASILGGLLGLAGLPAVFRAIESRTADESAVLRFSETLVSTVKRAEISVHTPIWPMVVTIVAIILLALVLNFLFLRVAYRGGTLRRGKSRVRVPRGKTSTFSSGSLRYALLSIRRGGPREAVVVAVSAVLAVVIIVLGGVYRGWENQLDVALQETQLEGQVTSSDGRSFSGLALPISNMRELVALDDVGEIYVSIREVYWMAEDMPAFGGGGFAQERRQAWIDSQSEIVCVNNLKGAKEFYFTDPSVEWIDGYDEGVLADETYPTIYGALLGIEKDKEMKPYPAVVSDSFMENHHLAPGVAFTCLVRGGGALPQELPVSLKIVGVYHQTGNRAHIYLPLSAFIPPDVLFSEDLPSGNSYGFRYGAWTEDNYKAYIYDYYFLSSCRFTLTSAAHLEEARAALDQAGFGWPGHLGAKRTTLILRDASFVKMTENLSRYLSMGRVMLGLIFAVVALLGFIISWLMISGRKREFAVMRGFGAKRGRLFLSFFWEQALLCALGCAIGCVAMIWLHAGGTLQWLVLAGYVICYLAGCAVSVKLIGKMNLMELLATRE